ncbi:MAG: TIGR00153 family protein [Gammaproteobacteria bacterium]|nr:TIGR00153 family protein [Gammaproteobacteria bacterium]
MGNLFNVFGPSPIKPIEHHMKTAHQCARQLYPFFEAILQQDWQQATQIKEHIEQLENKADHIKRDLRLHLPTGLFLPFARTDLLELLHQQDRIANKAKDIAGLIIARSMQLPPPIQPLILPFLARCLDASNQASKAINELDELLETGFKGNEIDIVESMVLNLDAIEEDSDALLAQIQRAIFELESSLPAIEIVFLYQVVQWIGTLADIAQTIGARLQILIAR